MTMFAVECDEWNAAEKSWNKACEKVSLQGAGESNTSRNNTYEFIALYFVPRSQANSSVAVESL